MRNLAANRQNFHSGEEGLPADLTTRAVDEYLAVLDEEPLGAASQVVPPPPGVTIGPEGEVLTKENLPPPATTRWVSRRKAEVVAAVKGGLLTPNEACERYQMNSEALETWQRLFDRAGMPGLRATRMQYYREHFPE